MKKIISALLLLSFVFPTQNAWPAIQPSDRQFSQSMSTEVLGNPGFEYGTSKWTASGGTLTTTTSAANVFSGNASGSWDSSSASQTLVSSATYTNGGGPTYVNGVGVCWLKCASGSCTHTLTVDDGSTNLATPVTITSSTAGFFPTIVNFIFGTGGTARLKLTSVASNEPILYIDSCYVGSAMGFNISQIGTATPIQAYTPTITGMGSASNISFFYWQIADQLYVMGSYTEGTVTAALTTYTLPNSLTIDSSKVSIQNASNAAGPIIGEFVSGVANQSGPMVTATGTSTTLVYAGAVYGGTNPLLPTNASTNFSGTHVHSVKFSVPVTNQLQTLLNPNRSQLPTTSTVTTSSHTGGFSANTTGTYTAPTGTSWVRICGIGAGAGGGCGGTACGSAATDGNATTFSSFISLPGGLKGARDADGGAGGGAPTISAPALTEIIGLGGAGGPSDRQGTSPLSSLAGGQGGSGALGGAGAGGAAGSTGNGGAAAANTGGGGGGGEVGQATSAITGSGGGSGTWACAILPNPTGAYSFTVGAKGTGQAASGTTAGGNGADGQLAITEFYGAIPAPLLLQGVTSPQNTTGSTVINNTVTKSSTYTATTSDETIIFNSGTSTLNFPAAANVPGKKYEVISAGSATLVTIDPNASETVCGQTTILLQGSESGIFQSDGTNWQGLNKSCSATRTAHLVCSSSSAITDQQGSDGGSSNWITAIGNISSGGCAITMRTGAWSVAPRCVMTNQGTETGLFWDSATTTTNMQSRGFVTNTLANATSHTDDYMCFGPR